MCIAIYKPAGKSLSKVTLYNCFQNNSDGAGFAYINTDIMGKSKIVIKKSMDFEDFYKKYKRAIGIATESPFLIHFRIGTHGVKSTHNVHPFMIDKHTCFMHNGIIHKVTRDAKDSDTRMFNREILSKLPKGWIHNEAISLLLKDYLSSNKVITLGVDGHVAIYGENLGFWVEGVWYSNKSYESRVWVAPTPVSTKHYPVPAKRSQLYNHWTLETCEFCTTTTTVRNMYPFKIGGEVVLLCKGCRKDLLRTSQIHESDAITVTEYVNYLNSFTAQAPIEEGYETCEGVRWM